MTFEAKKAKHFLACLGNIRVFQFKILVLQITAKRLAHETINSGTKLTWDVRIVLF